MEATLKETGAIAREVHFTLTAGEFEPFKTELYKKIQKRANLKGFRKGMAPLAMVKKLYGSSVNEEAAEEAVQKSFASYAEEHKLEPFGTPYVSEIRHQEDGGVEFVVQYEILPEIGEVKYKGLQATKLYHVVTPEEIEKEIEWLRERHRTEETVDTIADENHVAVVDFQKLDESGVPIIGEVSKDIPVTLKSEHINPELKEKLIGKRLDDRVRIELPTGEDEGHIPYELTIKDIKQVALPEIDDEFASKITGEEESDVEDLKDTIKQSIEAEYEAQYRQVFRDSLVDQLIELNEVEAPNALVGQILSSYLEDEKKNYKDGKLPEDFPMNRFYAERGPSAIRIAQWLLLRDRIIEAEELEATEEDFEALAQIDAQRIGMDAAVLLNHYRDNDEVRQRILVERVMQLLSDYAEVVEEIEDKEWEAQRKAEAEQASNETESAGEETEGEEETSAAADEGEGTEEEPAPSEESEGTEKES